MVTTTDVQGIFSTIASIIAILVLGFIVFKVSSDTGTQITLIILILGLIIFLS